MAYAVRGLRAVDDDRGVGWLCAGRGLGARVSMWLAVASCDFYEWRAGRV